MPTMKPSARKATSLRSQCEAVLRREPDGLTAMQLSRRLGRAHQGINQALRANDIFEVHPDRSGEWNAIVWRLKSGLTSVSS